MGVVLVPTTTTTTLCCWWYMCFFNFFFSSCLYHFQLCSYSYIMMNIYLYVYLLELQSMKGCKALRHRFPFCGIESFFNSLSFFSLSLLISHYSLCCRLWTLCRLFLSLSLLFFLLLQEWVVFFVLLQLRDGTQQI